MKTKDVLIWSAVIVGLGLTGYVIYTLAKPKPVNNPVLTSGAIAGIGNFISGLFAKKVPDVSLQTGYSLDQGVNYYDTGIGSPTYDDPNYQFTPVEEG